MRRKEERRMEHRAANGSVPEATAPTIQINPIKSIDFSSSVHLHPKATQPPLIQLEA
jgi:hypothetical protein